MVSRIYFYRLKARRPFDKLRTKLCADEEDDFGAIIHIRKIGQEKGIKREDNKDQIFMFKAFQ